MEKKGQDEISSEAVLAWMETASAEQLSEVIRTGISRYKTLFPHWEFFFWSLKIGDPKERRKQIRALKRILNRYG